ncbi:hypothetical protein BGX30_001198 [Mortierella sp. GBA39]|nr:hypothetical protein BGX30_001198 [Mortierella sp. GBA39]
MYRDGTSVKQDCEETISWLRRTADLKSATGLYHKGCLYSAGRGIKKNGKKARKLFLEAAEQGYAEAQFMVGTSYDIGPSRGYKEALEWYLRATKYGYVDPQYELAVMFEEGRGIPVDFAAFGWYLKAVQQGDVESQLEVGQYFRDGKGIGKSRIRAKVWFEKAADQGNTDAHLTKHGLDPLPIV